LQISETRQLPALRVAFAQPPERAGAVLLAEKRVVCDHALSDQRVNEGGGVEACSGRGGGAGGRRGRCTVSRFGGRTPAAGGFRRRFDRSYSAHYELSVFCREVCKTVGGF
jgi:hypothetical protein